MTRNWLTQVHLETAIEWWYQCDDACNVQCCCSYLGLGMNSVRFQAVGGREVTGGK